MTSSFSMPGGNTLVKLFRAEPMITLGGHLNQSTKTMRRGKIATQWVPVKESSSSETVATSCPTRPAAYVGQIIAVAARPAATRS